MSWGVIHANTQRQRQRQRQIHLGPEVESHYRPYMCYIFGKPWVQGPLWHCSPPPHTIYYDTVPPPQDDFQARRALGSRRPHSNCVSTSACDTSLNCIGSKCICHCICICLLYLQVWHPITFSLSSLYPGLSKNIAHVWSIVTFQFRARIPVLRGGGATTYCKLEPFF